jgi:glycosyltransferase involved in cell wall biosynthesis
MTDASDIAQPALSIAIPAFNEQDNVASVLAAARARVEPAFRGGVEWILVDDGSTDATGTRMQALADDSPNVRKVAHAQRRGLGAAIWTGLSAARGELFCWLPADGQIDPGIVVSMAERAASADLVMLMREEQARESGRRLLTLGMYALFRLLLGFDPYGFSGLFLTHRRLIAELPLQSTSGVQNYAVVVDALRRGQRNDHFKTVVGPRLSGRSKVANLRTTLRVLRDIVELRAHMSG